MTDEAHSWRVQKGDQLCAEAYPFPPLPAWKIGLDLSDRTLRSCKLDAAGGIVAKGALPLTRTALCKYIGAQPAGTRAALGTGGQSAWVRDVITGLGHEAVVGNVRELAARCLTRG